VAESFFATIKKELVRNHVFATHDTARIDVFEYIEVFYNRRRAHSLLGYMSPSAFEACALNAAHDQSQVSFLLEIEIHA
jgi:putative transposase